jgi:hypothetical protein
MNGSTYSWPQHYLELNGQLLTQTSLPLRKEPPGAGWAVNRSGQCRGKKISPLPGKRRRGSVVGRASGYGLDESGRSSSPGRAKNFLFSKSYRPALGFTQPSIQWVPGALSPGVKRQGAGHFSRAV